MYQTWFDRNPPGFRGAPVVHLQLLVITQNLRFDHVCFGRLPTKPTCPRQFWNRFYTTVLPKKVYDRDYVRLILSKKSMVYLITCVIAVEFACGRSCKPLNHTPTSTLYT